MPRAALLFASLLLAVPVQAADAPALFRKHCAGCHGKDGRGVVKGKPRLRDLAEVKEDLEDLTEDIAFGIPDKQMPYFKGKLSDTEIDALARWIQSGMKRTR
jgi:mono/diheme cytochrome c family protein